jgi:hypothetical protein
MDFQIIGKITNIEPIAVGHGVRDSTRLNKQYGRGHWRKLKGFATVILDDNTIHKAEIPWYEAHGIGKRELKIKLPCSKAF